MPLCICSADGGWSDWTSWTDCIQSTNLQTRRRTCNNPSPACGGKPCSGDDEENQACSIGPGTGIRPIEPDRPSCVAQFNFQS